MNRARRRPCAPATAARGRRDEGFTLSELLLVLMLMAITLGIGATAWSRSQGRVHTASAARETRLFLHRARMQAIYRNLNHFVAFKPDAGELALYADTGSEPGIFDNADDLVASTHLASGVELALPAATVVDPVSGATLASPWTMPAPSGGAWHAGERGVLLTPRGVFRSAVDEPQNITTGTIVFSTPRADSAAVTLQGTMGTVRAFEYFKGQWKEM